MSKNNTKQTAIVKPAVPVKQTMAKPISGYTDPAALRTLMANAKRLGRDDIWREAFRKLCSLEGMDQTDQLHRDFYQTLAAYEQLLTLKNGRATRASRTRLKLKSKGVVQCLEDWALSKAVIAGWHKLLTYKDEYEVARLHAATDYGAIARDLGIGGDYALRYHLHPTWARRMGAKKKLVFGGWFGSVFGALRHMKGLRGTPFDVFGWDSERRLERAIADEYEAMIGGAIGAIDYDRLVELAASPSLVKGYGPVKERNIARWRERTAELVRG